MNNTITDIYQVFKDYFGEDKVDLQEGDLRECSHADYSIIVHWDSVVITNEMNRSTEIYHLYATIGIDNAGTIHGYPAFLRSEYTEVQWKAGYTHSHIPTFSNISRALTWRASCLGTGPINRTIDRLSRVATANTDVWLLFCVELDKYVTVESLTGGPYMRMENIEGYARTSNNSIPIVITPYQSFKCININHQAFVLLADHYFLAQFVPYLINHYTLPLQYYEGKYHIGATDSQVILDISNVFIEWYNLPQNSELRVCVPQADLIITSILQKVVSKNNQLYTVGRGDSKPNLADVVGTPIFTFKGQQVTLTARGNTSGSQESNSFTILHPGIIGFIIYNILRFIDCAYGQDIFSADKEISII